MSSEKKYDIIIIGAGLAGLAASIRLRIRGKSVLVIEKNDKPGGKLDAFEWNGFRFDKGPSLFTQPEQIDELFSLAGKNAKEHFNYKKISESCRYFFENERLDLYGTKELRAKSLSHKLTQEELNDLEKYIEDAARSNEFIGEFFLSNPKPTWKDIFKKDLLMRYPEFLKLKFRTTLNNYNRKKLKSDKLIKIFNRYGTYNGSNPFEMSGLYSMISHLENSEGTYFPEKGMRQIPDQLFMLAQEVGVDFTFNEEVKAVPRNEGYQVVGQENYACDKLICAIDHVTFYNDVINDDAEFNKYKVQERSSSGVVFYWALDSEFDELGLHNIFFSSNYADEFRQIFKLKQIPSTPTVYVHVSSVVNPSDAPKGKQNWFVMINTPAGLFPTDDQLTELRNVVIEILEARLHKEIASNILHEKVWTAKDLEELTGAYTGALYGASSNKMTSALVRHGNTSAKYKDLYFCGGTVHPGGGIPLVLKSAKIVDRLIHE